MTYDCMQEALSSTHISAETLHKGTLQSTVTNLISYTQSILHTLIRYTPHTYTRHASHMRHTLHIDKTYSTYTSTHHTHKHTLRTYACIIHMSMHHTLLYVNTHKHIPHKCTYIIYSQHVHTVHTRYPNYTNTHHK
jgi:hypothetical protein